MNGDEGLVVELWRQAARWLVPRAPESIRAELERQQLARIREHMPLLYVIASLNTLIVMGVCAHAGIDVRYYGWMSGLIVLGVVRTLTWRRTKRAELSPAAVSSVLRKSTWIAVVALVVTAGFATFTFVSGTFSRSTLIPNSLAFGAMLIAFCTATLRPSAIAALALGIVPAAIAMLAVGDFDARILGLSSLTVAALMTRFVASQYDQLAKELLLQKEVYDLANTDMLTSLPNRRAMVASMERELSIGNPFGIALLDLDGFKGVNDKLGHLAGDALLRVVADRMRASCTGLDTVGRLGGDEFLVVFRGVRGVEDVSARAATLLTALCQPTVIEGETIHVRASLGTSTFPGDGHTTAALLAAADAALYATKRARAGVSSGGPSEDRRRHRSS